MKISTSAQSLAGALGLAASLAAVSDRRRKFPALEAITLNAGGDNNVVVSANVLDFALMQTVPVASIASTGSIAVDGQRLAALVASFPGSVSVTIASDGTTASVVCGRSRFKLPVLSTDDMPTMLTITDELGRLEFSRADVVKMLSTPLVAVGDQPSRYYLTGIFLHAVDDALAAVATDGHRLVRVIFPDSAGPVPGLIFPRAAARIALRLLADKRIERVTLRCSATLCAIDGPGFTFVSKLIDGAFPDYQRAIPRSSGNIVIVNRDALLRSLDRLRNVADAHKLAVIGGLRWSDAPSLHLCLVKQPDAANDVIDAETVGVGRLGVDIRLLAELLDSFDGERVCLDTNGASGPLLITNPSDPNYLALLMPCTWINHEETNE